MLSLTGALMLLSRIFSVGVTIFSMVVSMGLLAVISGVVFN